MASNLNGIDYVVIGLLALSMGMGIFRGFVKEVISLIAWIAAFTVATLYALPFAALFTSSAAHAPGTSATDSVSTMAVVISYLALFAGVLILGSIIKFIVNYAVEGRGISVTNRLLGALLGIVRGAVVVLLVMFFVSLTAMANGALWKESVMVGYFKPAVKWVTVKAQPYLSVIEAKMKKAAKNMNDEELTDVIKHKAESEKPAVIVTEPAKPETATAPGVPAPLPAAVTPVVITPEPTAAPAPTVTPAPAPAVTPAPAAPTATPVNKRK